MLGDIRNVRTEDESYFILKLYLFHVWYKTGF